MALNGRLRHGERNDVSPLVTVAEWIGGRLHDEWLASWNEQLPRLTEAWERIGEPAYGIYNRELFRAIQVELDAEGFTCSPRLPGNLDNSEEHWGPEDFRERRMWTILRDSTGTSLGALVTRFFHDHTLLRLPAAPIMEAVAQTDHDRIRATVMLDPRQWAGQRE